MKKIKAIIFILIGILFMVAKFYAISYVTSEGVGFAEPLAYYSLADYWNEFFKPTIINYIFGVLFIVVGLLEFKEAVNNGS